MFTQDLMARAEALIAQCRAKHLMLATAESCTGGLVAGLITEVAGSSVALDRGFVTYSNAAKHEMLGVPERILEEFGAVSQASALAMAAGALQHSNAAIAVSVTGIAGPGGGSADKPVGLVHFACRSREGGETHVERRFGSLTRAEIRLASLSQALTLLEQAVAQAAP